MQRKIVLAVVAAVIISGIAVAGIAISLSNQTPRLTYLKPPNTQRDVHNDRDALLYAMKVTLPDIKVYATASAFTAPEYTAKNGTAAWQFSWFGYNNLTINGQWHLPLSEYRSYIPDFTNESIAYIDPNNRLAFYIGGGDYAKGTIFS